MRVHVRVTCARGRASVSEFESALARKQAAKSGFFSAASPLEEKRMLLNYMLHCCDLGNPAKPLYLSIKWLDRVTEEFFQQARPRAWRACACMWMRAYVRACGAWLQ